MSAAIAKDISSDGYDGASHNACAAHHQPNDDDGNNGGDERGDIHGEQHA